MARVVVDVADEVARTITDSQVEQVLVATLEATPTDATLWSSCPGPVAGSRS